MTFSILPFCKSVILYLICAWPTLTGGNDEAATGGCREKRKIKAQNWVRNRERYRKRVGLQEHTFRNNTTYRLKIKQKE